MPKRYQSVFLEGTPLTSFGVRNEDNQLRSHSVGKHDFSLSLSLFDADVDELTALLFCCFAQPSHHIQTASHQRPLKPVKEFLTTHPLNDQQLFVTFLAKTSAVYLLVH